MKKYHSALSKRTVTWILTGVIIISVFVILQNTAKVVELIARVFSLISPFTLGIALAYILNLLLEPIEKYIFGRIKKPKLKRILSTLVCIIFFMGVIATLGTAIVPQILNSVSQLVANIQSYLRDVDAVTDFIELWQEKLPFISFETVIGSWTDLVSKIADWAKDLLPSIINISIEFGNGLIETLIAIFTSIYLLIDKEKILKNCAMIVRAFTSEINYNRYRSVIARGNSVFGRYIGGTLISSTILGILVFVGMSIMRIPYAMLISIIIACTNVIPTFGTYLGTIPATFIVFIASPIKALYFLIFAILMNQLEANIITPLIIGDVTGLSPLWVLVSIILFGSIWGVTGMALGVPFFAMLYYLAGQWVKNRLEAKDKQEAEQNPATESET